MYLLCWLDIDFRNELWTLLLLCSLGYSVKIINDAIVVFTSLHYTLKTAASLFTAFESFSLIVRSFFDAPASTISIIIEMNPHSPIKSEQKDSTVGWLLRMMALSLLCHDSVSFVVHRSPRIVSRYTFHSSIGQSGLWKTPVEGWWYPTTRCFSQSPSVGVQEET